MPLIEIVAGLLFVVSSGLFFNERFRTNTFLVVVAGLIAVGSTVSLFSSFGVGWTGTGSLDPDPDSLAAFLDDTTIVPQGETDPPVVPVEACEWSKGISMDRCIDTLSHGRTWREATRDAYRSRARHRWVFSDSTEVDLTVAIDHGPGGYDSSYFFRGIVRMSKERWAAALEDCDRFTDAGWASLLELEVAFSASSPRPQYAKSMVAYCRGVSLSKLGRHAEALPVLNQAVETGAGDRLVYESRAATRRALGDAAGAESDEHAAASVH